VKHESVQISCMCGSGPNRSKVHHPLSSRFSQLLLGVSPVLAFLDPKDRKIELLFESLLPIIFCCQVLKKAGSVGRQAQIIARGVSINKYI